MVKVGLGPYKKLVLAGRVPESSFIAAIRKTRKKKGNIKMCLDTLQEVIIDNLYDTHKFIVANVSDSNGRTKMVMRVGNMKHRYHSDIVDILLETLPGLSVRCVGGGFIKIDPPAKIIAIGGRSMAFGEEPDRQQTVRMLRAAFPGFKVINVVCSPKPRREGLATEDPSIRVPVRAGQ